MGDLDYKESLAPKNWCFWTVVLKTLESPLDCKEIQPVHLKGNQSWIFIGRAETEAETPILWPPDAKSWLIWKDPDAGKDWGQEEKGTTEDVMVGWHHWLNGHGFGWAPGVGDGQGGLVGCSSWGHKESDTIEWHNWTERTEWRLPPRGLMPDTVPPRTAAARVPVPTAGHCWPMPLQETLKQSKARLAQSLLGVIALFSGSWCAQGFLCAFQASLASMRFDFKCDCAPS